MNINTTNKLHILFIFSIISILIIGCGFLVTSKDSDEIDEPTQPSLLSSSTPTLESQAENTPIVNESEKINLIPYTHPSETFTISIPENIEIDESEFSTFFKITKTSSLTIAYEIVEKEFTEEEINTYSTDWLDRALLETNYALSYDIKSSENENFSMISEYKFVHQSGEIGDGSLTILIEDNAFFILDYKTLNFEIDDPIKSTFINTLITHPDKIVYPKTTPTEEVASEWRLEPYPGSEYIADDTRATPDWKDIIDYHATALSIPEPYFWDAYLLPDGTKFTQIKDHFRTIMQENNYDQAMDKQWSNETYTLTYLHSVNKSKKNAVIFLGEYKERDAWVIILYSNPE